MRAIKVPDEYDINICMKKESLKEAEYCPWCSSTEIECDENPTVIKIKNGLFKKTNMLEFKCVCKSCGGIYATKPYPIEAENSKSVNEKTMNEKSISKLYISFILFVASSIAAIFGALVDNRVICPTVSIAETKIPAHIIYATSFGFSVGVFITLVLFLICDANEEL